ncbi:PP2C family protein-serine/threonine phosphatase [Streptomyces sp. SP18CS02]|uniref:PP2C family protein-serine/threonine phosphatase n=1 Tax=Streptomyces sp. SP18CS02 TaxID=3002531 RepID=UPI002E781C18|nr:PP2C family protein-serine/threonine phosphatase [Streptomyces sp. SP18CS02]MEE1757035.1 PP2C family protein-serine/threonine phosphatase [Streptomyces sp. SP18CS02]
MLLHASPHPAVVADEDGVVRLANDSAGRLFPGLRPGARLRGPGREWLADAHGRGMAEAAGACGDRYYTATGARSRQGRLMTWWLRDDTEQLAARTALSSERERTSFLVEASNQLLSSLNARKCMATTARLAARHLADAALVIGPNDRRRLLMSRAGADGTVTHEVLGGETAEVPGLAEALQGFPPVPSRWIDPAGAPSWVRPEGFGDIGSMVVTPLPGNGVPAGALILLRRAGGTSFTESEEVFARIFAARAGAAISAALLYAEQSSVADMLMRDLLPPRLEQVDGVELAGGYRTSGDDQRIGGDFYDVHPAGEPGGTTQIVLGDVCGKGLEAAVLTGKIRNTLQALRLVEPEHERMLQLLNGALLSSHHTRYATLVLASVSRGAHGADLRLTSAGHPPPLIVRSDGRVETARTGGTLVGALPEVTARTFRTSLQPGEVCLLYSDGITEARGGPFGGELFGEERLAAALAECAGMPAEAVVERIQMLAGEWVGQGRHDDMALVAITTPRRNHLSAVGGHGPGRFTA